MAAKGDSVIGDWPKWKIALAVGTPIAVGAVGVWWYRRRSKRQSTSKDSLECEASSSKPAAEQTPLERAVAEKNKGNKYFKGGKYEQAIKCYDGAIDMCPPESSMELATFYQNRAAAHEQLKMHEKVIEDCSKALECNCKYTKALFRRAKACEVTKDYMQCLEDVTAVCILENFQNAQSLVMAERVLKELGRKHASEDYPKREPVNPSRQYIRTYYSTFAHDPIMSLADELLAEVEEEKAVTEISEKQEAGDFHTIESAAPKSSHFKKAVKCLRAEKYEEVIGLCTQELEEAESQHRAAALLLRATFHLLGGNCEKALVDFDDLLKIDNIDKRIRSNALIKRGSLQLQSGEQTEALDDLATAVREDPENSDIYHHRGQLNLLIDRVEDAVKDFQKSVTLSPDFAIAHVQKCYTEYRLAFNNKNPMQLKEAMQSFEDTLSRFSDCAEGYALYGQALCDRQMFDKADEKFQKALELEPDNANIYVHRGLLALQWRQDVEQAAKLIKSALKVDDRCNFAYETLGTIEVQRGNLDYAIELFEKAIKLAKTEVEMAHLYSLHDAAIAQARVAKNFGITVPLMGM